MPHGVQSNNLVPDLGRVLANKAEANILDTARATMTLTRGKQQLAE